MQLRVGPGEEKKKINTQGKICETDHVLVLQKNFTIFM
jgi:hypothetical protein